MDPEQVTVMKFLQQLNSDAKNLLKILKLVILWFQNTQIIQKKNILPIKMKWNKWIKYSTIL